MKKTVLIPSPQPSFEVRGGLAPLTDIERVPWAYSDCVQLIFCKAPIAGQVKTRLIPELTAEKAAELHKRLTRFTIERAQQAQLCPVQLWCAPDTQHDFFQQCAEQYSVTLHHQIGNDLGERMHNAFIAALQDYRHAILTGCDCPSLQTAALQQAIIALRNGRDAVIAPAEDGGYVLIGLNEPHAALFEKIPWSTEKVMELTRTQLILESLDFYELSRQWDVDNPRDLMRLRALKDGLI